MQCLKLDQILVGKTKQNCKRYFGRNLNLIWILDNVRKLLLLRQYQHGYVGECPYFQEMDAEIISNEVIVVQFIFKLFSKKKRQEC